MTVKTHVANNKLVIWHMRERENGKTNRHFNKQSDIQRERERERERERQSDKQTYGERDRGGWDDSQTNRRTGREKEQDRTTVRQTDIRGERKSRIERQKDRHTHGGTLVSHLLQDLTVPGSSSFFEIIKLSRGEICVPNFIPPANGASLGSYFCVKNWTSA